MAEGRMLKRSASRDDRLGQLSEPSCVLFLLSIAHLDVEGRMDGSPAAVRGTVASCRMRHHPDDWTDEAVAAYMAEWTRTTDTHGHPAPLVLWYEVKGEQVCEFVGFKKNQRLRADREAPSRFPAPPEDLLSPITSRAVASRRAAEPRDAAPAIAASPAADADPQAGPDAVQGPLPPPLFADSGVAPEQVRAEVEVEVEVQALADQRGVSRAREGRGLAALLEDEQRKDPPADDLAASVKAGVARRYAALETDGPIGRLLALLHDADENTPATLHALFDPLGERAVEFAIRELESYGTEIRRPSAYAVGIAKRLATSERRRGRFGRLRRSGQDDLRRFTEDEEQWERMHSEPVA